MAQNIPFRDMIMKKGARSWMEVASGTIEPLIERRRLPRLELSVPVQFRNILKPSEPFSGSLSKDISASGLRITTTSFLPRDAHLVMLISLPTILEPVRAIARALWTQKDRFSDWNICGIEFVEIRPKDREILASYVEWGVVVRPGTHPRPVKR